jgi:hypothetical protein
VILAAWGTVDIAFADLAEIDHDCDYDSAADAVAVVGKYHSSGQHAKAVRELSGQQVSAVHDFGFVEAASFVADCTYSCHALSFHDTDIH